MRRHIPGSLWLILLMLLSAVGESGSILNDPDIPDGEQIVWQVTKEGVKRTPTTVTWRFKSINGRQVYEITEVAGERKHSKHVINKSDLRLIEAHVYRNNEDGESSIDIEVRNGHQYLTYIEDRKKPKRKDIDDEPDGYNGIVLPHCLRGFPFDTKREVELKLTPPFRPGMPFWAWRMWKSHVKLLGTEMVTVPAGAFDCYKLEVEASGGLIKRLTSKYYFWFAKEPPYHFVKYQDEEEKNVTELIEGRRIVESDENVSQD